MGDTNKTPQSRNEEILLSMINKTEYDKTPQSREEELLLELKEVIEQGGGEDSQHHYSTDEQVVGTWIDGSTLYEKTFEFTPSYGTSWESYSHGISSINTIISIHAIITTQGTTYELPQYRNTNTWIVIGATATTIDYINNWLNDIGALITVTLRYTKTTN